jgi:cyclopropane fatty-acyl-phospholipid synthase-like methyltransferase
MTQARPSFRNLQTADDVASYTEGLAERWPARATVIDHIVDQVQTLAADPLHVLELAPGAGVLAERLLQTFPQLRYVGIDSSIPMLAYVRQRLDPFGERAAILDHDLNGESWQGHLAEYGEEGRFHAVVSLQSIHDLGGELQVERIYTLVRTLLLPGGFFLNADLIVQPGEELPDNPGRRSIVRHLELLQAAGYGEVSCTLETGGFGVVIGRV